MIEDNIPGFIGYHITKDGGTIFKTYRKISQ